MKKRYYASYDICFCSSKCNWKKRCERHEANVPVGMIYSAAPLEGADICPKTRIAKMKEERKKENERKAES